MLACINYGTINTDNRYNTTWNQSEHLTFYPVNYFVKDEVFQLDMEYNSTALDWFSTMIKQNWYPAYT
jgi:hypothetical protein